MPTNATRPQQAPVNKPPAATLTQEAGRHSAAAAAQAFVTDAAPKFSGYGLPCSKCKLYYPADLDSCPTCHHTERVSPIAPKVATRAAQAVPDPVPDSTAVEQEREEFLRQFKSQLMEAHAEVVNTPGAECTVGEHTGEAANAEICKACYERLQERLDVCEGALHLDLKEAAQIIYDAVWSDPSDPTKTYQNAANALLTELRKRSGINSVLGPFQPLPH
jgi:hypothetical protein